MLLLTTNEEYNQNSRSSLNCNTNNFPLLSLSLTDNFLVKPLATNFSSDIENEKLYCENCYCVTTNKRIK